jgi:hypothetical protein
MSCNFSLKISAPEGFENILPNLNKCKIKLALNDQGILYSTHDKGELDWSMEKSKTNLYVISGAVFADLDKASKLLNDLSNILVGAGFPHELRINDEDDNYALGDSFMWVGRNYT